MKKAIFTFILLALVTYTSAQTDPCASAITVNLSEAICSGETYTVGSKSYTETGLYKDTLQSYQGCDSIVTLDLTVNQSYSIAKTLEVFVSDPTFEALDGSTILQKTDSLTSTSGCDSIIATYFKYTYQPNYYTDTTIVYVYDTIYSEYIDTVRVEILDTTLISVTDTLVINLPYDITGNLLVNPVKVSIYPNPTKSVFFVDISDVSVFLGLSIAVYSQTGQILSIKTIDNAHMQFDISEYVKGTYFVMVMKDDHIYAFRKIVLQ